MHDIWRSKNGHLAIDEYMREPQLLGGLSLPKRPKTRGACWFSSSTTRGEYCLRRAETKVKSCEGLRTINPFSGSPIIKNQLVSMKLKVKGKNSAPCTNWPNMKQFSDILIFQYIAKGPGKHGRNNFVNFIGDQVLKLF